MKTFRGEGKSVRWANSTGLDVSSGDVVVLAGIFGIAVVDIADGASGIVSVFGEHELAATTTDTWVVGANLYWNAGTLKLTDTVQAGGLIGVATKIKTNGLTSSTVLLNGGAEAMEAAANVAAAGAATAAPAAPTAAAAALTYSDPAEQTQAAGDMAATGADALDTTEGAKLNAHLNAVRADVAAIRTEVLAAGADLATQKIEVDKVIADVAAQKAELDKLITDDLALRTTLNAEIAALKAAGHQASA